MDRQRLAEVADDLGIELLVQFGSTVSGTSRAGSDVDLGVLVTTPPSSFGEHADLAAALQQFYPGQEIDLVVLNHADPLLLKQVTEQGVLLCGVPNRWKEFQLFAFKRYQDHRRFLQMERDYVARAAALVPR